MTEPPELRLIEGGGAGGSVDAVAAILSAELLGHIEALVDEAVERRLGQAPAVAQVAEPRVWFDAAAAADYLGISRAAVHKRVQAGKLRAHYNGRKLAFHVDDLNGQFTERW